MRCALACNSGIVTWTSHSEWVQLCRGLGKQGGVGPDEDITPLVASDETLTAIQDLMTRTRMRH